MPLPNKVEKCVSGTDSCAIVLPRASQDPLVENVNRKEVNYSKIRSFSRHDAVLRRVRPEVDPLLLGVWRQRGGRGSVEVQDVAERLALDDHGGWSLKEQTNTGIG